MLKRHFVKACGAGFLSALLPAKVAALAQSELVLASAAKKPDGSFVVALLSETGALLTTVNLPRRGHDIIYSPASGHFVAFARRPGVFAVVFDKSGNSLHTLGCVPGRHFYGHGQFSTDGRLLFATENDFENGAGKIGVYDATNNYRRMAEWSSGGVGPHDLLLTMDGTHLCVANGGIETHPDFGRQKLNLPTMQPNISWIEISSGHTIVQHHLPPEMHQLSTRHLSAGTDGTVWFAAQNQARAGDAMPLVGQVGLNRPLAWLDMPETALNSLRGYVGSIAVSPDGDRIALSSPVGNSLLVLNARGEILRQSQIENVNGVVLDGPNTHYSTGNGLLGNNQSPPHQSAVVFDNHLFAAHI